MKEFAQILKGYQYGCINPIDWGHMNNWLINQVDAEYSISDTLFRERVIYIYGTMITRCKVIPEGWIFAGDKIPGNFMDLLPMKYIRLPVEHWHPILETKESVLVYIIMNL